jgi:hypothetical protein
MTKATEHQIDTPHHHELPMMMMQSKSWRTLKLTNPMIPIEASAAS